ncbi:hypothetical protein L9F63_005522, partial [Diploptera punctata]
KNKQHFHLKKLAYFIFPNGVRSSSPGRQNIGHGITDDETGLDMRYRLAERGMQHPPISNHLMKDQPW